MKVETLATSTGVNGGGGDGGGSSDHFSPIKVEVASNVYLNKIAKEKTDMFEEFFSMEPMHVDVIDKKTQQIRPRCQGESVIALWDKLYGADPVVQSIVVETVVGPSTPHRDYYDDAQQDTLSGNSSGGDSNQANPVMPYQQLRALVGDGGKWKWPEIWKSLDTLPRRGKAYRHADDPSNLQGQIVNPNPHIVPLNCLVVGGGPVGLRLAIELVLGGHRATIWEKRRETRDENGNLQVLGFTNRVNRPHINNFCRNDLDRLNGRRFMSPQACYPVFTNAHTSSIGIDECQMLLLKTALLLGVQFKLGVGYETAVVDIAPECRTTNQRPTWLVTYQADEKAVQRYGLDSSGCGTERFDALFGCDGGNSRVRKTQVDWLGEPHRRTYKRMFAIVANLRKCSKSKLKELGYARGLEPEDRAGLQTGVYFYKASFHNYLIVHPSKEEMDANGIPWTAIYSFDKGRQACTEKEEEQERIKSTLKKYMTKKAKALGIPIDETAENDGFVEAPNDVMGFDFSQFYNCEKSAAAFVPPLSWNVKKDGEWEIFCPLVSLAGDAVTDPNWLLGVGLQRGWNSAMDSVFYADNLYNNVSFNGRPPSVKEPIAEPVKWSQHLDNLMALMQTLGNAAREGNLSSEMDVGTFNERGPVVAQIKRKLRARNAEPLVPAYTPNVEPWGRYKCFELEVARNYKGKLLFENKHPLAERELALFSQNERYVERAQLIRNSITRPKAAMLTWPKRFECSAFWGMMSLMEIDGKLAPGSKAANVYRETSRSEATVDSQTTVAPNSVVASTPSAGDGGSSVVLVGSNVPSRPSIGPNPDEVKVMAQMKSTRLHERIVAVAMNGPSSHHHSSAEETLGNIIFKKSGTQSKMMSPPQEVGLTNPISEGLLAADAPSRAAVDQFKTVTMKTGGMTDTVHDDPALNALRQKRLTLEKKALLVKLAYAQAEVTKVAYEQRALEAKMLHARTEVETIQQCLEAYEEAEAKLKAVFGGGP